MEYRNAEFLKFTSRGLENPDSFLYAYYSSKNTIRNKSKPLVCTMSKDFARIDIKSRFALNLAYINTQHSFYD